MLRAFALGSALAFALAAGPGTASDEQSGVAAEIDRACASDVDRALAGEPRSFARVYGHAADGTWHPLSAAVKWRIAHDPDIYSEVADAWRVDKQVVLVAITARSLDLRAEAAYCFRRSGTLARVMESSTGTEVRDDEMRYFDESGGIVAARSKFYALTPSAHPTVSPEFKPSTPTLYRTVRELPFFNDLTD